MATGIKTGGRQRGSTNRVTRELREVLKDLLEKEFENLGTHLDSIEPMDRLDVLIRLLPYALPKSEPSPSSQEGEGKKSSYSEFFKSQNVIHNAENDLS